MPQANYYPAPLTTSVRNTLLENRHRVRMKSSVEIRLKNPVFALPSLPEVLKTELFVRKSEPAMVFFEPVPKRFEDPSFSGRFNARLEWALYLTHFFGRM